MEIYTIYISCIHIQIFPPEAKLQEFKEGPYQKLLKGEMNITILIKPSK